MNEKDYKEKKYQALKEYTKHIYNLIFPKDSPLLNKIRRENRIEDIKKYRALLKKYPKNVVRMILIHEQEKRELKNTINELEYRTQRCIDILKGTNDYDEDE